MIKKCLLAAALILPITTLAKEHPGVDAFVKLAQSKYGLSADYVRPLLSQAEYKQSIIDAITRPAEGKPWHEYQKIFLTDSRINNGIKFWRENCELIDQVSKQFEVPAEIIVAIIGVETNYGGNTGSYRVLDALTTLGLYYPKRAAFFSDELMQFMLLTREEQLPLGEIRGSYAGAMGMGQFIPSSYRHYSVDFDGDGRRDLWQSKADAIASVANYFRQHGWRQGAPVVAKARGSVPGWAVKRAEKPKRSLAEYAARGVTGGETFAPGDKASLLELDGPEQPEYWFAFHNFYVITRYNRSPLYAMAVHQLSQELRQRFDNAPG